MKSEVTGHEADVRVVDADTVAAFEGRGVYADFDSRVLELEHADAHVVALSGKAPVARASVWWHETPELDGSGVGAIGHFAADSAEAARLVLDRAERLLTEAGVTSAVGPLDGNTWRRYRFVTQSTGEPPFALEPTNPSDYPAWWASCGYAALAHYSSALDRTLEMRDIRMGRVADRMAASAITIRPIDTHRLDQELSRIYRVALASFPDNFLYTPLSETDFKAQYLPYARLLVPELVLVAEDAEGTVGFVFALPDVAQAQRGLPVDTVILKTVAVLPGRRHAGLGSLLVEMVRDQARQMGFRQAIYALMYDGNVSRNIAEHFGETMRRYTLYRKDLCP